MGEFELDTAEKHILYPEASGQVHVFGPTEDPTKASCIVPNWLGPVRSLETPRPDIEGLKVSGKICEKPFGAIAFRKTLPEKSQHSREVVTTTTRNMVTAFSVGTVLSCSCRAHKACGAMGTGGNHGGVACADWKPRPDGSRFTGEWQDGKQHGAGGGLRTHGPHFADLLRLSNYVAHVSFLATLGAIMFVMVAMFWLLILIVTVLKEPGGLISF